MTGSAVTVAKAFTVIATAPTANRALFVATMMKMYVLNNVQSRGCLKSCSVVLSREEEMCVDIEELKIESQFLQFGWELL